MVTSGQFSLAKRTLTALIESEFRVNELILLILSWLLVIIESFLLVNDGQKGWEDNKQQ